MTETGQWIDADGVAMDLEISWDVAERFMPPSQLEEDEVPGEDGTRLRGITFDARDFPLTIWLHEQTEQELRTAMRNIALAMNPKRGPGKIRFTTPFGDQREISCTYKSGLGFVEKLGDTSGLYAQRATIIFRAHDPNWSDTTSNNDVYGIDAVPNFFPIFPLRLSSSQVVVVADVINTGDLDAWPIITINGPGSVIKCTNLTTGLYFEFPTGVLGVGESVIIDTRPTKKTVLTNSGVNAFSLLSSTSTLWPLVRGTNSIILEMSGASAGVSQIGFQFTRLWLTV